MTGMPPPGWERNKQGRNAPSYLIRENEDKVADVAISGRDGMKIAGAIYYAELLRHGRPWHYAEARLTVTKDYRDLDGRQWVVPAEGPADRDIEWSSLLPIVWRSIGKLLEDHARKPERREQRIRPY